jgi:hypothetical protein
MKYCSVGFGFLSAILWFIAAIYRIPAKSYKDYGQLEARLQRVGWLNAAAALCSAVSISMSVFSN